MGMISRIGCSTSLESNYHIKYLYFPGPPPCDGLGVISMYLCRLVGIGMYVCMGMVPRDWYIVFVSPSFRPPPVGLLFPWNPIIMQGTSAGPPPLWAGIEGLVLWNYLYIYLRRFVSIHVCMWVNLNIFFIYMYVMSCHIILCNVML